MGNKTVKGAGKEKGKKKVEGKAVISNEARDILIDPYADLLILNWVKTEQIARKKEIDREK